jgi:penicillin-binding protein 1A
MLPFVFAAAFENGSYPGSVVDDSPLDNRAVMIGGTSGILGEWGPETADNRYEGAMTARQALAKSKNGATVRIGMDAGLDNVMQLCRTAGIRSPLRPYPATFLGSSEVTLAELALAYTIFPNGGWRPAAIHILERIEEKDGTVVWDAQQQRTKQTVIKPETAYEVHSCLVDALETGTAKSARTDFGLKKFPAAGKTGTAYDFTDALFAGYDSNFSCAVWAGFDKPQKIYRGAFGREIALPVWVDIMNAAAAHYPPIEVRRPPDLKEVEICSRSGLLATDKCYDAVKGPSGDIVQKRTTYMEIATPAQMPTERCNVHEPHALIARDSNNNDSAFPRAELAVDLNDVKPVNLKAPIVLAEKDPYNSATAQVVKEAAASADLAESKTNEPEDRRPNTEQIPRPNEPVATPVGAVRTEDGKPVLKAIPVAPQEARPAETERPIEVRKAIPVGPLEQEEDDSLLKSATPPPSNPPE